jgi:hypothetical protein
VTRPYDADIVSYMRQLAADYRQAGWHAQAFPLSIDGIEVVASLVLLADRTGRRSGWLPGAALAIGTAGSLAANVATAGPVVISRVIVGWPAVALVIAVKLWSGILERQSPVTSPRANQNRMHQGGHDTADGQASPVPRILAQHTQTGSYGTRASQNKES